jgi:hypothetical protein
MLPDDASQGILSKAFRGSRKARPLHKSNMIFHQHAASFVLYAMTPYENESGNLLCSFYVPTAFSPNPFRETLVYVHR